MEQTEVVEEEAGTGQAEVHLAAVQGNADMVVGREDDTTETYGWVSDLQNIFHFC